MHLPPGGIGSQWQSDDGKDIGLRFHYYNRAASTDTNAALVLADDTQYLEFYNTGSENSNGDFTGTVTYGTFKTGSQLLVGTTPSLASASAGTLQVSGGVGIAKDLYVGTTATIQGNLTVLGTINATITGSITTATNLSGTTTGGIPYQAAAGITNYITPGAAGTVLQSNGTTATFVSTASLYVGNSVAVNNTGAVSTNASYYLNFVANNTTSAQTPGTTAAITVNPSTGVLSATQFTGSGAGLTNIPNSALTNSTINVSAGNSGIGVIGSPVALGGTVTVTNLGVTSFSGGTTGLTPNSATTGSITLAGVLSLANGGTNANLTANPGAVIYSGASALALSNTGTTGQILVSAGQSAPVFTNTTTIQVGYANAVLGGAAGNLVYQTGANATSFVTNGTTGQVLLSNGSSAPAYASQSTLSVGTSTNIAGGAQGSIPIQSAAGTTTFVPIGTSGYILQSNGSTATWVSPTTFTANTATDVAGGTAGSIVYQAAPGITSFIQPGAAGTVLQSNGSSSTYVTTTSLYVGTSVNIGGGAANQIPFQSNPNATSFSANLTYDGTTLLAGQIKANGTAGSYNTATGALQVIGGVGVGGSIFVGGVVTATTFVGTISATNTSTMYVGFANEANNILGGAAGNIVYQTGSGATNFASNIAYSASGTGSATAATGETLVVTAGGLGVTGASYFANNVGFGGNVTISGTLSVGGVDTISATTASFGTVYLTTSSVSNPASQAVGISATTLDTFSTSTYRSAKYVISVSNTYTNFYQASEVLVVHDGVTPYLQDVSVATGSGNSSAPIMTFTTSITGGNVLLQGTGTSNTNTVKVSVVYVTV